MTLKSGIAFVCLAILTAIPVGLMFSIFRLAGVFDLITSLVLVWLYMSIILGLGWIWRKEGE